MDWFMTDLTDTWLTAWLMAWLTTWLTTWLTLDWHLTDTWLTLDWHLTDIWLTFDWHLTETWLTIEWRSTDARLLFDRTMTVQSYWLINWNEMRSDSLSKVAYRIRRTWPCNVRSSTDFLFSNILTFQNYVLVVCNRTMNDIHWLGKQYHRLRV